MENRAFFSKEYTEAQLYELVALVQGGMSWDEIAKKYNRKFNTNKSSNSLRHVYRAYKDFFNLSEKDVDINTLKEIARTKRNNSKTQRQNKLILDQLIKEQDVLEDIKLLVSDLNKKPKIKVKRLFSKKKKSMTIEALLSDIHYGKKTQTFDLEICRRRVQHFTSVLLREINDNNKRFNVDRLIVALLGDIIESATMHGVESSRGCEFGNSRQVQESIRSLFEDVMIPLAQTGIKIDVVCVTGNHDRTEHNRTYHNPGEENLTWIIYKTLEMLCKQSGFTHIKFDIPVGPYATLDIYGKVCLYEHYDNAKANSRQALYKLMMDRANQTKKVVSFMRGGHFHEATAFGRGTIITNGSVCGQDSFADVKGYDTEATQTINYYIETKTRPTPFYQTFPVYLP